MRKILTHKYLVIALLTFVAFIVYLSSFVVSYDSLFNSSKATLFSDVGRLDPEKVVLIDEVNTTEQLVEILKDANEKGLKVSIAGSRHSQGGHTYYKDNVVVDMRGYKQVLSVDPETKTIVVQAGAKWSDVQDAINPHNLAVKVMQSSNVFTIGGTLSANAHGRDLDMSSVIETVESFRLLKADGEIINVSRSEYPDLFSAVIGGYGLFGIILDVTLFVADNDFYVQESTLINSQDLPDYFSNNIKDNPAIAMMLARPSINLDTFMDEMVVSTWSETDKIPTTKDKELTEEKNIIRDKFFFGLSREFDWAKNLRWYLQKKVELAVDGERFMTRNNSMRPPLAPLEFLDYYSNEDTDLLQEYYIPISHYPEFLSGFKTILQEDGVNVISFTVRYVKANNESMLSYCPLEDCFAVIFMTNVGLSATEQNKIQTTVQRIVDLAIMENGTYYLTYQLYPTRTQLTAAYPRFDEFIALKKKYDPQELFINKFYKKYEN